MYFVMIENEGGTFDLAVRSSFDSYSKAAAYARTVHTSLRPFVVFTIPGGREDLK